MTTKHTQYRAVCPICFHEQAVSNVTMVQHGYTRPEWAHEFIGPCEGVHQAHFGTELGREVTRAHAARINNYANKRRKEARDLRAGKIKSIMVSRGFGRQRTMVEVTPTDVLWSREVEMAANRADSQATSARTFATELRKRCDAWVATLPRAVEVEDAKLPLVHYRIERWGKACAGSAMGARKGYATTDKSRVNCEKCLIQIKRLEERARATKTTKVVGM